MPRHADHAERRREIVAATQHLLAAEGLEGATMRRIADIAGCTTGRLTHYFESRDEILVATLRSVHEAAASRMQVVVERESGIDALRGVMLEALPLDRARLHEWRVWLAFWGRAAVDPALRRENTRRYRDWRSLLRQLIAEPSVRTGADIEPAVTHTIALIDGLGIQTTLDPAPRQRKAARATVDAHVLELGAFGE